MNLRVPLLRLIRDGLVILLLSLSCLSYSSAQESKGPEELLKLANQGDVAAQAGLGAMYYKGQGVAQDYAEAARWFRKAADQGNDGAQFVLGNMYSQGQGVVQDYSEAARLYRKLADQGDTGAQFDLGVAYALGQGVPQDGAEAVKWFRKAADQGEASAQFQLGFAYESGVGVPQDRAEALKWYRKAADQEDAEAQRKVREWQPTTVAQTIEQNPDCSQGLPKQLGAVDGATIATALSQYISEHPKEKESALFKEKKCIGTRAPGEAGGERLLASLLGTIPQHWTVYIVGDGDLTSNVRNAIINCLSCPLPVRSIELANLVMAVTRKGEVLSSVIAMKSDGLPLWGEIAKDRNPDKAISKVLRALGKSTDPWLGAKESELIIKLGPPSQTNPLQNGDKVLVWQSVNEYTTPGYASSRTTPTMTCTPPIVNGRAVQGVCPQQSESTTTTVIVPPTVSRYTKSFMIWINEDGLAYRWTKQ